EEKKSKSEVRSYYLREMLLSLDHPLVAQEMEENCQIERRLGMRIHQSYWNAEIVELLYRIPPRILNHGDRSKGLVREMVNRRFPNLGFGSQKKVTATNFFDSLVKEQATLSLRKLGGLRKLAELGIVDEKKLDLSKGTFSGNNISPTF